MEDSEGYKRYNLAGWKLTNHGNFPVPTVAQLKEMAEDATAMALYGLQDDVFFPGLPHTQAGQATILPDFETTGQVNKYARDIQRSAYVKKLWPRFAAAKPVRFYIGREDSEFDFLFGSDYRATDPTYLAFGAAASTNNEMLTVAIKKDGLGRAKSTILHELAHVINDYEHVMRGHGPEFVGTFRQLVQEYMPDKFEPLTAALKAEGLKWTE